MFLRRYTSVKVECQREQVHSNFAISQASTTGTTLSYGLNDQQRSEREHGWLESLPGISPQVHLSHRTDTYDNVTCMSLSPYCRCRMLAAR